MALYTVTDTELTSIADSIREKGGSSEPLSFPVGFMDAIDAIPTGGGGGVDGKDVNFIDYDGTILYSYTATEAQELTELPGNPSHTGLTAQGWNWTLANIKSYLTDYPDSIVYVGQTYITDDSKTRIHITLDNPTALSPYLSIAVNGTASIDWGDGSATDTMVGEADDVLVYCQHVYGTTGDYVISITVVSGHLSFFAEGNFPSCLTVTNTAGNIRSSRLYSRAITKINVGSNVRVGNYAFTLCQSLTEITLPYGITSIGGYAFNNCYSLESVTIPNSVTSIGTYAFVNCSSMKLAAVPDSVTSIGDYAFYSCNLLRFATIPDSVTSIGSSLFYSCYSLLHVNIPDGVTSIGSSSFFGCALLWHATISDDVTSIGSSSFQNCFSLCRVNIPDSVTTLDTQLFRNCYVLKSITIPGSVTDIKANVFANCASMLEYHLMPTTPPTITTSTFGTIPEGTIIYVPYSADHSILEAYKTADNWSTYASQMQEEPQP